MDKTDKTLKSQYKTVKSQLLEFHGQFSLLIIRRLK